MAVNPQMELAIDCTEHEDKLGLAMMKLMELCWRESALNLRVEDFQWIFKIMKLKKTFLNFSKSETYLVDPCKLEIDPKLNSDDSE